MVPDLHGIADREDVRDARAHVVIDQDPAPLADRDPRRAGEGGLALMDLARGYLAIGDTTGARTVVAEADAIVRRRPLLGALVPQLADLRGRVTDARATFEGSSSLTTAELRLLPDLSTPYTFKEIGERLFLSPHTVKTQAVSIYRKLDASTRSEAIERAIELGLLEPFPGVPLRYRPPA
jgi:LuxR family maltose regulon positive regulatory protein